MNHPSNGKKDGNTIEGAVRRWRTRPDPATWPSVACVLCGRPAARFYGKVDVPLAESDIYRNSTPRGHDGMALCWPCVSSFHALPYGCHLTGGPAIALHSWDERFMSWSVRRQVVRNQQAILVGRGEPRQPPSREVVALHALRRYADTLDAGLDLLVFSNNNRGQTLDSYAMSQPLAEWLRSTMRPPDGMEGFRALLQAHRTKDRPGVVALARNAFRDPARVIATCSRYLIGSATQGVVHPNTAHLTRLCFSYATEVLSMDDRDLKEIRATAGRVAALLIEERSAGKLREFYSQFQQSARLRSWLRRRALDWALRTPNQDRSPLVTTRGYELLFDPSMDSQAWFHREMFLIAVFEDLHRGDWPPADADQVAKELQTSDELALEDKAVMDDEEEQ